MRSLHFATALFVLVTAGAFVIADAAAAPTGKWFDKFMFVVLENQDLASILNDPNFKAIAAASLLQTNYHAVAHPSQPNYWAVIAGDHLFPGQTYKGGTTTPVTVNGDKGDDNFDIYNTLTLIDLLDAAGLDYKVYSENYPTTGQCYLGASYGNLTVNDVANYNPGTVGANPANRAYKRKHNPFISFATYTSSSKRCAAQKDFNDLNNDLASGNIPAISFVVPNQAHDGHDTTLSYSGVWFLEFIKNVTSSPVFATSRVLVHVPYDEDDTAYTYFFNAPVNNAGNTNPYYNATCAAIVKLNSSAYPANYCAPAGCKDLLNCPTDVNDNKVYSILLGN